MIQDIPPEGRMFPFLQSWKKLSKDHEILGKVKGYKVPLLREAVQETVPLNTPLRGSQKFLVEKALKKLSFCYKEKRSGSPSSYKPECSKSVCDLHALQNVKFADFKIHVKERRLHMQN